MQYNTTITNIYSAHNGDKLKRILKESETYSYLGPPGDGKWMLRGNKFFLKQLHDTISYCHHLGGESGINTRGMEYFLRNIFNRWTTLGRLVRMKTLKYYGSGEEERTSCSIKLKDLTAEKVSIYLGDHLGSIMGFNEKTTKPGLKSVKSVTLESDEINSGPEPRMAPKGITSKTQLGSNQEIVERRSHIYLECSICEGSSIGGSFRKVLKVIPVMERFCSGRYLTYDVLFPEYVRIEGTSIQNIRFSLRDPEGDIIESKYTNLPTTITCSILEE